MPLNWQFIGLFHAKVHMVWRRIDWKHISNLIQANGNTIMAPNFDYGYVFPIFIIGHVHEVQMGILLVKQPLCHTLVFVSGSIIFNSDSNQTSLISEQCSLIWKVAERPVLNHVLLANSNIHQTAIEHADFMSTSHSLDCNFKPKRSAIRVAREQMNL